MRKTLVAAFVAAAILCLAAPADRAAAMTVASPVALGVANTTPVEKVYWGWHRHWGGWHRHWAWRHRYWGGPVYYWPRPYGYWGGPWGPCCGWGWHHRWWGWHRHW
jgi:hypothetical protein